MKLITLLILSLLSFNAYANTLNIDPSITGQTTLTVTCTYPIAREDGTLLAINEIAKVNFWVTKNGIRTAAGSNTTECKQVYDMTLIADDTYLYTVTTVDTGGRESVDSTSVTAIVKRLALPKAPSEVAGALS